MTPEHTTRPALIGGVFVGRRGGRWPQPASFLAQCAVADEGGYRERTHQPNDQGKIDHSSYSLPRSRRSAVGVNVEPRHKVDCSVVATVCPQRRQRKGCGAPRDNSKAPPSLVRPGRRGWPQGNRIWQTRDRICRPPAKADSFWNRLLPLGFELADRNAIVGHMQSTCRTEVKLWQSTVAGCMAA